MMRTNRLVTPPALEPVSVAEFKAHARVDFDADDALIGGLIKAARAWCENYTGRAFIAQTWRQFLSERPDADRISLVRAPLIDVTSVRTYDDKDNESVWDAANYFVDASAQPAYLVLRTGAAWAQFERCANGMAIEYVAGYGANASDVPEPLRLAITQLALHWYEHRGEVVAEGGIARVPLLIESLLQSYRLCGLGAA